MVYGQVLAEGQAAKGETGVAVMNEHDLAEQEFQAYAHRFYTVLKKAIEADMMKAIDSHRHGQAVIAAISAMLELAGELEAWVNESSGRERAPIEAIYETYTYGYNEGFSKIIRMKNDCEACPNRSSCDQVKPRSCVLESNVGAEHNEH